MILVPFLPLRLEGTKKHEEEQRVRTLTLKTQETRKREQEKKVKIKSLFDRITGFL